MRTHPQHWDVRIIAFYVEGAVSEMHQDDLIITSASKRKLEEELQHLRLVKRPEITEAVKRAREYGDLSENFEYHAARQSQAILNGRMAEIEAILERAKVVENDTAKDSVGLGAIVMVCDLETDDEWEYTIVDAASADPLNDLISYSSPVGQALLDKKIGETVEVEIPAGITRYEVKGIRYE